jgi:hypothetical protein
MPLHRDLVWINVTTNPTAEWVGCDVDPDQVSTVQSDDDEGVKQIEADRRTTKKSMAAISGA